MRSSEDLRSSRDIVNMVAKCNEKVKEELCAAVVHLQLHGTASLECASATDDQGEIVCTKLGVSIRSVGVCVSSRSKDCAGLDS